VTLLAVLLLATSTPAPAAATADAGLPAETVHVSADAGGTDALPDGGVLYKINDPKRRDSLRFTIDGTFLQINGVTSELEGEVRVVNGKATAELKVQAASIRTGDAVRDSHLRTEEWLDAKKHPYITFKLDELELPAEPKDGAKIPLKGKGEFEFHGVKHEEPVELTVWFHKASDQTKTRHEGDLVHVQGKCKLKLDHFKLEARKKMPQEVGDTAEINLDAWGSTKL
jgi:polyisoprenoid-binding protein YceI